MSCIDLALVSNLSQVRKCAHAPLTDYDHGHSGLHVSMSWKDVRRPTVNGNGRELSGNMPRLILQKHVL